MDKISKMKSMYNKLLQRQKKAELYLDNPNIDIKLIEDRYIVEYQKIVRGLSWLLNKIENYTLSEALDGFKV